jgi:plasmid stabilization system protein ParE
VSLHLVVSPEADQQFIDLLEWWETHRPDATVGLEDEFHRVTVMLAEQPHLGRVYERQGKRLVRHYPLRGTPYHVFYEEVVDARELHVLAVWSMMRKQGPPLRAR